jgi:hypothetical protein
MTKTLEQVIRCNGGVQLFDHEAEAIAQAVREWMLEVCERDNFMSTEVDCFIERATSMSTKPENVDTSGGCVDAVQKGE